MIRIDTKGVPKFVKELELELARLDREISEAYYNWTVGLFAYLVDNTAQFSGDLTSNWNYSVGQPDFSYHEWPMKYEYAKPHSLLSPHQRGDPEAVTHAMDKMRATARPNWRDTVLFANATPVADLIEGQRILLRPVNLVAGQAMTLSLLVSKAQAQGFVT